VYLIGKGRGRGKGGVVPHPLLGGEGGQDVIREKGVSNGKGTRERAVNGFGGGEGGAVGNRYWVRD